MAAPAGSCDAVSTSPGCFRVIDAVGSPLLLTCTAQYEFRLQDGPPERSTIWGHTSDRSPADPPAAAGTEASTVCLCPVTDTRVTHSGAPSTPALVGVVALTQELKKKKNSLLLVSFWFPFEFLHVFLIRTLKNN